MSHVYYFVILCQIENYFLNFIQRVVLAGIGMYRFLLKSRTTYYVIKLLSELDKLPSRK